MTFRKIEVKLIQKLIYMDNPIIKNIKAKVRDSMMLERTKWKERTYGNKVVPCDVDLVVGEGASKELPLFSSRIYYEVKSLKKILGNLNVEKSLEIGCGYARLTPWIAEYSNHHYAIEPEKKLYDWAVKLYPEFSIVNTSCDKLKFPDNYFDLIVSWTVLQHIPPGKFEKSIEEIKRVLKEKGILVIVEYTRYTPSPTTWGHSIQEYCSLFNPKKLIKNFKRKGEKTKTHYSGEVMKFI